MSKVNATRMEMLARRAQIKLASQGAELLRNKRDALLKEFMVLVNPLAAARKALQTALDPAMRQLVMAYALNGHAQVASAALATARPIDLNIKEKNLWGLRIAEVEPFNFTRPSSGRGYSPDSVSARIDETAEAFEEVMNAVVALAPIEAKVKRLGQEIRKTSRRVNALEEVLIPRLSQERDFIRSTLEERDREDNFRLKKTKHRARSRAEQAKR